MSSVTEKELKDRRFEATALIHINSIYRFALRMAGNEYDAQDLVQDTYLRAYKFFDKFEDGTNCKAWLLKILKNTFINSVRRNVRHPQPYYFMDNENNGIELPGDMDPEEEIFGELLDDNVSSAIDSLPIKYRTVVLLADMEGLSYKEISDIINCPIGTVMSRLHRGRQLLRKKLKKYALKYGYEESKVAVS